MELKRVILEDRQRSFAVDLAPGLTVAHHENPAMRAGLVAALADALGPAAAGLHAEFTHDGRYLAVFRPNSGRQMVVDIDAAVDVSADYTDADGRVNVLGALGADACHVASTMVVEGRGLAERMSLAADRTLLRLSELEPEELWAASAELLDAEERLSAITGPDEVAMVERTIELEDLYGTVQGVQRVRRSHRSVRLFGFGLASICAVVGIILIVLEPSLQDKRWTGRVLMMLAVGALALVAWDSRALRSANRTEREHLAALGVDSLDALVDRAPAQLRDHENRKAVLQAAVALGPAADRWQEIASGISAARAQAHRRKVEDLRSRNDARLSLMGDLPSSPGLVALADALVAARDDLSSALGAGAERGAGVPLVLDEPFLDGGADNLDDLLALTLAAAGDVQVVLVTGDAAIKRWAASHRADGVGLVRLTATNRTPAAVG